jgi:hypothetical protein
MTNLDVKRAEMTIGAVARLAATASVCAAPVSVVAAVSDPRIVLASGAPGVGRVRAQAATTIQTADRDPRGADRAATGVHHLPKDTAPVIDSAATVGANPADRVPVNSPAWMIEDLTSGTARDTSIVRIVPTSQTIDALKAGQAGGPVSVRRRVSAAPGTGK